MKALDGLTDSAHNIGLALRMKPPTVRNLEQIHGKGTDRCAISIMGTWLSGNHMTNGQPYTLHEEQYPHPSWWNLVWAVAREAGGRNPARAEKIAQEYRGLLGLVHVCIPTYVFQHIPTYTVSYSLSYHASSFHPAPFLPLCPSSFIFPISSSPPHFLFLHPVFPFPCDQSSL